MRATILTIINMAMVFTHGKMAKSMTACGKTANNMVKAPNTSQVEEEKKERGSTAKCSSDLMRPMTEMISTVVLSLIEVQVDE